MTKQEVLQNMVINSNYTVKKEDTEFQIIGTVYLDVELENKKIFKFSQENKTECIALSDFRLVKLSPDLRYIQGVDYKDKTVKKYRKDIDLIADRLKLIIDKAIATGELGQKKVCKITFHQLKK